MASITFRLLFSYTPQGRSLDSSLPGETHRNKDSPADMAMVVPATMPMVTPLPLGGGMGAGYTVAGMPLGCTTVVWWMT